MKWEIILSLLVSAYLTKSSEECSGAIAIQNPSELVKIGECEKYTGDIQVFDFSGSVKLPSLKKLKGNLVVFSNKIESIILDKLEEVDGDIKLKNFEQAVVVQMAKLKSVKNFIIDQVGGIDMSTFQPGLDSIDALTIRNSRLQSIQGITAKTMKNIDLVGNPVLKGLKFANLTRVESVRVFGSFGVELSFPNLEVVINDFSLVNFASVSIPSLGLVGRNFKVSKLAGEELSAPKLVVIGNNLDVQNNDLLTSATFPELSELQNGSVTIKGNPRLKKLDISKLYKVGGGFTIHSPSISKLDLKSGMNGVGALDIRTQVDCNEIVAKTQGNFANTKCEQTEGSGPEPQPSKSSGSGKTEPSSTGKTSDVSLVLPSSALFLLVGILIIL